MKLKKTLKKLKLNQNFINTFIGLLGVVIFGFIALNYFTKNKEPQIIPPIGTEEEGKLPTTYVVQEGDDLWKIAEEYYESGYNWVDIAEANNIDDPNLVEVGQILKIPDVQKREVGVAQVESVTFETTATENTEVEASVTPTATPTPEPQVSKVAMSVEVPEDRIYTVQRGDDLWHIAEKYFESGYNWVDIAKANNIKSPYVIIADEKITIPQVEARKITVVENTQTQDVANKIDGDTYKVQKGDNLWEIAVRAYGDGYKWVKVAKENNLENPGLILPDQELKLPR